MDGIPLNLTTCDREPIHLPGLIQPHGALLVLQADNLHIIQLSQNTQTILGHPPAALLGKPLTDLFENEQVNALQRCLEEDFESINPLNLSIKQGKTTFYLDGIVHQQDNIVLLELEPKAAKDNTGFVSFYHRARATVTRIQKASSLLDMCQVVVEEVRRITGFDRVMVYRFDDEGAGSVIAESTDHDTSYLNLRYPPSDIPKQARYLYTLNWLRIIPNVQYEPIPLLPTHNPQTGQPLDMSLSVLRSVSPLHLERVFAKYGCDGIHVDFTATGSPAMGADRLSSQLTEIYPLRYPHCLRIHWTSDVCGVSQQRI